MSTQFTFARRPHPVGETDATNAAPPASRELVASDYFHPNHSSSNHSTTSISAIPSAAKIKSMGIH